MVQQYCYISWVIFSWLELALQVKVGKVASFVGKIFVVRPPTTKTTNILLHKNYIRYIYTGMLSLIIIIMVITEFCSSLIIMAGHEQSEIQQATPLTGPPVNAEDKPLLKNNKRLQGTLFFSTVHTIKSRAANMILFWNTVVVLTFELFAYIGNVFVCLFNLFEVLYSFKITRYVIVFLHMIRSGVYGVIAFWLLFYPLAGYLADVRFGKYKVVMCG